MIVENPNQSELRLYTNLSIFLIALLFLGPLVAVIPLVSVTTLYTHCTGRIVPLL